MSLTSSDYFFSTVEENKRYRKIVADHLDGLPVSPEALYNARRNLPTRDYLEVSDAHRAKVVESREDVQRFRTSLRIHGKEARAEKPRKIIR